MSLMKIFKHFIYLPILLMPLMAQDVTLDLGEVDVDGYTADIVVPVSMQNANHAIGGIQFDLNVSPSMISISGASPAGGLDGFAADYTNFGDGASRIVMYNQSAPEGIPAGGTGVILNLHFDGSDVLSAVLDLGINSIIVSGVGGEVLSSSGTGGSITIGDVVYLSATQATGDVGEIVELSFNLTNSGNVGGVQFDLFDSPNYVDGINFSATDRTAGFNIAFSEIESGIRVLVFSESNDEILPGDGAILTGQFQIHDDAYADEVGLQLVGSLQLLLGLLDMGNHFVEIFGQVINLVTGPQQSAHGVRLDAMRQIASGNPLRGLLKVLDATDHDMVHQEQTHKEDHHDDRQSYRQHDDAQSCHASQGLGAGHGQHKPPVRCSHIVQADMLWQADGRIALEIAIFRYTPPGRVRGDDRAEPFLCGLG